MQFTLDDVIKTRARWGLMTPNTLTQFISIVTKDLRDQLEPITKALELPNEKLFDVAADLREANIYLRTNVLAWYHIVDLYRLDVGKEFYDVLSKTMHYEHRLDELVKEAENEVWRIKIKAAEEKSEALWDQFNDQILALIQANIRGEL